MALHDKHVFSGRQAGPSLQVRLLIAGIVCLASGCVEHGPASFPTARELPDEPRRADGVAVDMTSEPPPFRYAASSDDAVVTLKAPLGEQAAMKVVRAFFEAVALEDISALATVTASSARIHDLRATRSRRSHSILSLWRDRFNKHPYEQLPAPVVYRQSTIASFRASHAHKLPLPVRYRWADRLHKRDLLLQVPITTPGLPNERLFGDEIYFLLRHQNDRYVIAEMAEQVPF